MDQGNPEGFWNDEITGRKASVQGANRTEQPAIAKIRNVVPGDLAPQDAVS